MLEVKNLGVNYIDEKPVLGFVFDYFGVRDLAS